MTDPLPKHGNPNGSTAPRFADGYVLTGRWILKRRIGQGRYSDVYAAISNDESMGEVREVAIKVEKANIPAEGQLLKWEAEVLTDLQDCSYVCKMHEYGVLEDNGFYIVMDLCSETLSECRKRQPGGQFRSDKGAAAAISMLNCIEAVHRSGYVHRDIKPSNFVRPLKNAKSARKSILIDFGLARRHHKNGVVLPARPFGEFRGTSKYASINSHSCKELGPRDDMFSFMFVLIDFILGKLPWAECTSRNEIASMKRKLFGRDFVRNEVIPEPIYQIAEHLNTLRFQDSPDYNFVRNAVQELGNKRPARPLTPALSDSPVKVIPDITDASSPVKFDFKPYCESCLVRRTCEDSNCSLLHPPFLRSFVFPNADPLPLCLEFIRGNCNQANCALHHWTESEQSCYLATGSLPVRSTSGSVLPPILVPANLAKSDALPLASPRSISLPVPSPKSDSRNAVPKDVAPSSKDAAPKDDGPCQEQLKRWRNSVIKQAQKNDNRDDHGLGRKSPQAIVSCSDSGPCQFPSAETNTDEGERELLQARSALEKAKEQTVDGPGRLRLNSLKIPKKRFTGVRSSTGSIPRHSRHDTSHKNGVAKVRSTAVIAQGRGASAKSTTCDVSKSVSKNSFCLNRDLSEVTRCRIEFIVKKYGLFFDLKLPVDFRDFQSFEEVLRKSRDFKVCDSAEKKDRDFEQTVKNRGLGAGQGRVEKILASTSDDRVFSEPDEGNAAAESSLSLCSEWEAILQSDEESESDSGLETPPPTRGSRQSMADIWTMKKRRNRTTRMTPGPSKTRKSVPNLPHDAVAVSNPSTPSSPVSSDSSVLGNESSDSKHTESDPEFTGYCSPRIRILIKRTRRKVKDMLVVIRVKRSLLSLPPSKRVTCDTRVAPVSFSDFAPVLFDYLKRTMNETPDLILRDQECFRGSNDGKAAIRADTRIAESQVQIRSPTPEPKSIDPHLSKDAIPVSSEVTQSEERQPDQQHESKTAIDANGEKPVKRRRLLNRSTFDAPIIDSSPVPQRGSDPIIVRIRRDLISDFFTCKRTEIK